MIPENLKSIGQFLYALKFKVKKGKGKKKKDNKKKKEVSFDASQLVTKNQLI